MSERWAVEMLGLFNKGTTQHIRFGRVVSLNPLTVKIDNVMISRNLYFDPVLMIDAAQVTESLDQAKGILPDAAVSCLKDILSKLALQTGDRVIVLQDDDDFFILQRLVSV